MRKIIAVIAIVGALVMAGAATGQSTGQRHACPVVHRYLGAPGFTWHRGITHVAADETLTTTAYAYGSGACNPLSFQRWSQLMNLVFEHQGHGSFSWATIKGTWTHLRTVSVPHSCGDGGATDPTPYGIFAVRVYFPDGKLIDTATMKLRLAC